jgi:hypothetical protein
MQDPSPAATLRQFPQHEKPGDTFPHDDRSNFEMSSEPFAGRWRNNHFEWSPHLSIRPSEEADHINV